MYVVIECRTQTNNINGQLITFGRAKTQKPVQAAVRIQDRAECLQHPLGLLWVSSVGPIVMLDTNKHLRACAKWVYGYTAENLVECL